MKRLYSLLGGGLIIIIILAIGYYMFMDRGAFGGVVKDSGDGLSDYSAVFVEGGGIYFGKITKMDANEVILEEVYNYGIVPAEEADAAATTGTTATGENVATRPTLFDASKVGIAPANRYRINREAVILWYTLKTDSDVVKTINEYKAGN